MVGVVLFDIHEDGHEGIVTAIVTATANDFWTNRAEMPELDPASELGDVTQR